MGDLCERTKAMEKFWLYGLWLVVPLNPGCRP